MVLNEDAVLADAPKQHLTSSIRHFEKVLDGMTGTPEVARNAVHSRIESLKQELYSRDPTHVQVAKLQSAIDRAQATHAQKEQATEAARKAEQKAAQHVDELRWRSCTAHRSSAQRISRRTRRMENGGRRPAGYLVSEITRAALFLAVVGWQQVGTPGNRLDSCLGSCVPEGGGGWHACGAGLPSTVVYGDGECIPEFAANACRASSRRSSELSWTGDGRRGCCKHSGWVEPKTEGEHYGNDARAAKIQATADTATSATTGSLPVVSSSRLLQAVGAFRMRTGMGHPRDIFE